MKISLIKNKVSCQIFDCTYLTSSAKYSKHRASDSASLTEVHENIDTIKKELKAKELVILKQVHGIKILDADNTNYELQEEADGSITTQKNIALGILTADCVPVLLACVDGSIIGAAHCGWKSAKSNIILSLVNIMKNRGARDIKAFIGPSIQQKSYEVDTQFYQDIINENKNYDRLFINSENYNHYMFDLPEYVKLKLKDEGVEITSHQNEDTYTLADKYPSARRCAHKNEKYQHNILSTIIIK